METSQNPQKLAQKLFEKVSEKVQGQDKKADIIDKMDTGVMMYERYPVHIGYQGDKNRVQNVSCWLKIGNKWIWNLPSAVECKIESDLKINRGYCCRFGVYVLNIPPGDILDSVCYDGFSYTSKRYEYTGDCFIRLDE